MEKKRSKRHQLWMDYSGFKEFPHVPTTCPHPSTSKRGRAFSSAPPSLFPFQKSHHLAIPRCLTATCKLPSTPPCSQRNQRERQPPPRRREGHPPPPTPTPQGRVTALSGRQGSSPTQRMRVVQGRELLLCDRSLQNQGQPHTTRATGARMRSSAPDFGHNKTSTKATTTVQSRHARRRGRALTRRRSTRHQAYAQLCGAP